MRLIHQDGRLWSVPDAGYTKHHATYTRAGWRVAKNQDSGDDEVVAGEGIRIRSRHNEERIVSESEYAETYEPAGWVKADEVKPAKSAAKKGA